MPFTVVDLDPRTLDEWRTSGYHTVLGSSDRVEVLRAARVPQAGLLVVTTGDPVSVEMTAYHALQLQPGLDIVARVRARSEGEDLQHMGVQEVVWPEMEAGLEIVRHSLARYQTPDYEVDRVIYQLRERLSFVVSDESRRVPRPGQDGNYAGTGRKRLFRRRGLSVRIGAGTRQKQRQDNAPRRPAPAGLNRVKENSATPDGDESSCSTAEFRRPSQFANIAAWRPIQRRCSQPEVYALTHIPVYDMNYLIAARVRV